MSERLDQAFHALAVIKRIVDESHDLVARGIEASGTDRALAAVLLAGARGQESKSGPTRLHTLCLRVINERYWLANELESIRRVLANLESDPEARRRNVGRRGRTG